MSSTAPAQLQRVSETTFLALSWFFTATSFIFLIARLGIRIRLFKKLGWDDALVILAWCLLLAYAIIWQIKIGTLYWLFDIDAGKKLFTSDFIAAFSTFIPNVVTWNILYYCCLWSVKYSFMVFFWQLDAVAKTVRTWWWIVFAITTAGLCASIGDIDYDCALKSMTFIFTQCNQKYKVDYDTNTLYGNMGIDVLTDMLILSIPIRILWGIQIPKKRKMILYGFFSVTVVIMIISIIRAVLVKPNPTKNQLNSIDWLYLWSVIEMGIAIMIANVASFRQLFVGGNSGSQLAGSNDSSTSKRGLLSYLRKPSTLFSNFSFTRKTVSRSSSMEKGDSVFDSANETSHSYARASRTGASQEKVNGPVRVHSTVSVVRAPLPAEPQTARMYYESWDPVRSEDRL